MEQISDRIVSGSPPKEKGESLGIQLACHCMLSLPLQCYPKG